MVKYCNAACKKKHRKKHKNVCERRVAEMHQEETLKEPVRRSALTHDKELFKQPPPKEDCSVCFIQLPMLNTGYVFMVCCGKEICGGCLHAPLYDDQGNKIANDKCPFCRIPFHDSEEKAIERLQKRVQAGDAKAIYNLGYYYRYGENGFPQDYTKAL